MRKKNPELMNRIKQYIEDYYFQYGQYSSTTKIVDAVEISRAGAYNYLVAMSEKGLIEYEDSCIETSVNRKINLERTNTPIVGYIPCGSPQDEEENIEEYR